MPSGACLCRRLSWWAEAAEGLADGHEEKFPLAALPGLVTERGNPGNRRRITSVTVYLPALVLEGGVELVDTPATRNQPGSQARNRRDVTTRR